MCAFVFVCMGSNAAAAAEGPVSGVGGCMCVFVFVCVCGWVGGWVGGCGFYYVCIVRWRWIAHTLHSAIC